MRPIYGRFVAFGPRPRYASTTTENGDPRVASKILATLANTGNIARSREPIATRLRLGHEGAAALLWPAGGVHFVHEEKKGEFSRFQCS